MDSAASPETVPVPGPASLRAQMERAREEPRRERELKRALRGATVGWGVLHVDDLPDDAFRAHRTPSFTPSAAMVRYARAYVLAGRGAMLSEIAKAAGVSPATVRSWRHRHPGFAEWLGSVFRALGVCGPRAWQAIYERAMAGDAKAAKTFVRHFDPVCLEAWRRPRLRGR